MTEKLYFHHSMTYPDGTRIKGKLDHSLDLPLYGDMKPLLEGKNVLDIATNDGYWAFWAEQQGADVVAFDVGGYTDYDWGCGGVPEFVKDLGQQDKLEVFKVHHTATKSKIKYYTGDVYYMTTDTADYHNFDLLINYGLLYHLRNPRLALDQCYAVCNGAMILETQILPFAQHVPFALECGSDLGLLTDTDHNWPTESCIVHWLKEAGFKKIFVQYLSTKRSQTRQRFIACVDDNVFAAHFRKQSNSFYAVDDTYWNRCKFDVNDFARTLDV